MPQATKLQRSKPSGLNQTIWLEPRVVLGKDPGRIHNEPANTCLAHRAWLVSDLTVTGCRPLPSKLLMSSLSDDSFQSITTQPTPTHVKQSKLRHGIKGT